MASYLEKEQLVPNKPYMAPIEAILNTYKTKIAYWGYGAAQVKNAFNSFANLDLTRSDNKEELNGLMRTAGEAVNKASQTDLSVGSNRTNALNSFSPIEKNQDIMGDHAYTEHIQSELGKADVARTKDGGKQFNQASYDALLYQQQLFKANPNRSSWQSFYSNRDSYTPYYDKTDEIKNLQGMFKTDVVDKELPDGQGYLIGNKDASWYKDKWQAFVEANASPQLKEQLRIESNAEFRRNSLIFKDNPTTLYNLYNKDFDNMKNSKLDELNQQLNLATIKLTGLNKNAKDYAERKTEYETAIQKINGAVKSLKDPKNKDNILDAAITNQDNLPASENYISQLYNHKYFDQIGSSFAHLDVKQSTKMDGAYWANMNIQMKKQELGEDIREFDSTDKYRYAKLDQDGQIAKLKEDTDLAIAGLKKGADGKILPMIDVSTSNEVTNTGETGTKKLGQELYKGFNQTASEGYATIYDIAQGSLVGNQNYIKALSEDGSKPLQEVRVDGRSKEARDKVKNFIADAYWGSGLYDRLGIKDADPAEAKRKLMLALDTRPASEIKKLLNDAFGNKRIFETGLDKISENDGVKLRIQTERADQEIKSYIDNFEEHYGPKVKEVLKNEGYPAYISPDSDLYRKGVRGYEQELGKFHIPTEQELTAFVNSKIQTGDIANIGFKREKGEVVAYDKTEQARVDKASDIQSNIYKAIGTEGQAGFNSLVGTTAVTEKNKQQSYQIITSILSNMDNDNGDKEKGLAKLIRDNPDAITSYTLHGNGVDGKVKVSFTLDKNKFNDATGISLPKGYASTSISTTSKDVDKRFTTKDPGYISLLQQPKSTKVDFPDETVEIFVENKGDVNSPNFNLSGSYYTPVVDAQGKFVVEGGKLKLKRYSPEEMLDNLDATSGGNFNETLQTNPTYVYDYVVNKAFAMRELIKEINKSGAKTPSELPKKFMADIQEMIR